MAASPLEEGVGVTTAHDEITATFERYLDSIEPPVTPAKSKAAARKRR